MRPILWLLLSFSLIGLHARAQLYPAFTVGNSAGCTNLFSSFHDATTGGSVTSVSWLFVLHGTTDTVGRPSGAYTTFTFTDTGYYDVTEIVSNGTSTYDTTVDSAIHAFQPDVSFTTTSLATDTVLSCPGKVVTFVNTTVDAGCGSQFNWIFTNGGTVDTTIVTYAPTTTVTYTFNTPGNYNVTLYENATSCGCTGFAVANDFIRIDSPPVVCYSALVDSFCGPPATVSFSSSCTSGASSYVWHFGDHASGAADSSYAANPSHTYTAAGSYTDSLTVYSAAGCKAFSRHVSDIYVGNFYVLFAISGSSPFCADSSGTGISFAAYSYRPTDYYYWHDSYGHSEITASHAVSNYFPPGIYTATDSTWDTASNCSAVAVKTFTVYPSPIITFTASPAYRCTPDLTTYFTATITDTAAIDSVHWNFGDPTSGILDTSLVTSPSHIYSSSGTYTPVIIVKDHTGCIDSAKISNDIQVKPPSFHITPSADSGCTTFVMSYTTSMTPSVGYTIDSIVFGDSARAYIPAAGFTSGTHNYTAQGVYKMKVIYTLPAAYGGCSYADSNIFVVGSVLPTFSPSTGPSVTPDSVCPNTKVYFYANCTACSSFTWYFADGTSSHNYNDSDSYPNSGRITTTAIGDLNGCTRTFHPVIQVLPPQASIVAAVPSCDSANVFYFYNADSAGATGYRWNFGDGITSVLATPRHMYTVPAIGESFPVLLVDTGGGSHHCINKDSTVVQIFPIIDTFSVSDTSVCRFVDVTFTGSLPDSGSAYTLYTWIFTSALGSDTVSSSTNVLSYPFTDTGVYTVRLIVQNIYGCTDTFTGHSRVHVTGPIGGFSASPVSGCTPLTVSLSDHNTFSAGGFITSRQWQFSGPGAVAGIPPTLVNGYGADTFFTYPQGSFRIVLIDSDNNHCFSYDSIRVTSQKPHAYFSANMTANCAGKPIVFTDTNTHCSYVWNFGDSTSGTGQVATHIYTANGTYAVSVTIATDSTGTLPPGCVDSFVRTAYITIANIPVNINLISGTSAPCPTLHFLATPAIVSGYSYYWDINNLPPYMPNPGGPFSHYFTAAGAYSVTLLDSNALGCKDSVVTEIDINGPKGYISATPDSSCVPASVYLHFVDTGGPAIIPDFTWVTGDDSVYFDVDTFGIGHTYLSAGTFIAYAVISTAGCTISDSVTVTVFPVDSVTVNHPGIICHGSDVTLTATGAQPGDRYSWSPAYALSCTGCSSTIADPLVDTTYTVTLITPHFCRDSAAVTVLVDSALTLAVVGGDSVCLGQCDTLYLQGVYGNYSWTPDSALSSGSADTVIACPTSTYTYTITATDNRGCSATIPFTLTVNPLPDIVISPQPLYVCRDSFAIFTASGAGPGGTYVWSPDKFISDTNIAAPTFTDTADFAYKVVATTQYGCKDSDIYIKVIVYDSATTSVCNDTVICQGKSVELYATSSSGSEATYTWQPAASLNYPDIQTPYATPDTTTTYTVHIQENPCFFADRSVTVDVVPLPVIILPDPSTIIAGSSVQLTALVANSANVTQWLWSPANSLSCDTCFNPVATPANNTTYTVIGTTPIGCVGESSVQLSVQCVEASQVFVPNTFTPNGDGANDRFYLSGKGLGLIAKMSIYNRWGEQVFNAENISANDPAVGWDGTYKGQVLEPGVFVYVFELQCETGVPFTLKGDISLVR